MSISVVSHPFQRLVLSTFLMSALLVDTLVNFSLWIYLHFSDDQCCWAGFHVLLLAISMESFVQCLFHILLIFHWGCLLRSKSSGCRSFVGCMFCQYFSSLCLCSTFQAFSFYSFYIVFISSKLTPSICTRWSFLQSDPYHSCYCFKCPVWCLKSGPSWGLVLLTMSFVNNHEKI